MTLNSSQTFYLHSLYCITINENTELCNFEKLLKIYPSMLAKCHYLTHMGSGWMKYLKLVYYYKKTPDIKRFYLLNSPPFIS